MLDLLPKLNVPTLVLHCRGDCVVPLEEGRRFASLIPGSRFVPLEGKNHIPLKNEPAFEQLLEETRLFLGREIKKSMPVTEKLQIKTCPSCKRTYADDSLNYCLDDGARLSYSSDIHFSIDQDDNASTKIL